MVVYLVKRAKRMTSHYFDLTVIPDLETSAPQLLGALYDRLHLTLVQQRLDRVGVSFPHYSVNPRTLGNTLRLHAADTVLHQLHQADWLKGIRDHVRQTEPSPVPTDARHRTVQRRQFKTNAERLRRRRMRRRGETAEQAALAIPISVERRPDLPYVHLRSRSSGQPYCLFVALGPITETAIHGTFNSHGLGGPTTIPWF